MIVKLCSILLLLYAINSSSAQDNAQPRIAPALRRCYENRHIFERDNRLPMNPNMLVELIRKVEDSPGFTLNMRQLATSILFRFKQDGIIPSSSGVQQQPDILPFSVNGFHFHKHRVLLTRLIQGNANQFPNGTLNEWEECALHFMLSTSIETHVRGDEGQRCSQIAQLRAFRVPREATNNEDIEMLKTPEMQKIRKRLHSKFGRYQQEEEEQQQQEDENIEDEPVADTDGELDEDNETIDVQGQQGQIDGTNTQISQCPVENGVLHSPWGAIAAGTTLAGIAAGLAPQTVNARDLVSNDHNMGHYKMARQSTGTVIDNRYASTLSGDVAEGVLRQAPSTIQVGAAGAFNNTAVPHWYFLSQRERLEQTDAEIRAGIDGLLLGLRILEWHNQASTLRLSQVLDMYYSQRGLFGREVAEGSDTSMRACNRRNMFSTIPFATLRQQSIAFTTVLDGEMQSSVTLTPNSTARIATQAAESLQTYIASTLNDLTCASTQTNVGSETIWRTASDIYIFVDLTWPFVQIRAMIGHLLNNLDVGRFGTTYTILNANDGTVIVRTTNQLSDFYSQWNQTTHDMHPRGLNLPNVIREMRSYGEALLNSERERQSNGGRSLIALVVAENAAVNEGDSNFAQDHLWQMHEQIPDLRWIYWAAGSPNRFELFVRQRERDLFPLRIDLNGIGGDSIQTVAHPVIHRIQQEPRRIINHRCGSNWDWNPGDIQMTEFVEPRGVVFFKLHPNYFFHGTERRAIRITGAGFSNIVVCYSRTVERPRSNSSNSQQPNDEVTCQPINTETREIWLSNGCEGSSTIRNCWPLFVSIEGPAQHDGLNLRCTERECRFPDNSRFTITGENLGCFSSVGKVIASFMLLTMSLFMTLQF